MGRNIRQTFNMEYETNMRKNTWQSDSMPDVEIMMGWGYSSSINNRMRKSSCKWFILVKYI